jgi:hypothetical protein
VERGHRESAYNERWAEILGHSLAEIPQHIDSWRCRVHPDDMPRAEAELAAQFFRHNALL